jgi:hypothetical protein
MAAKPTAPSATRDAHPVRRVRQSCPASDPPCRARRKETTDGIDRLASIKVELTELISSIEGCEAKLIETFRTGLGYALRAGRLLLEVKRLVGHGNYTKWIAENLPISTRTARNYTRLAENEDRLPVQGGDPERQFPAALSIEAALKSLPNPRAKAATDTDNDARATRSSKSSGPRSEKGSPAEGSCEPQPPDKDQVRVRPVVALGDAPAARADGLEDDHHVAEDADEDRFDVEAKPRLKIAVLEDQSPDGQWLRTLPLRSQLADPTAYLEQAMLWRHLLPNINKFFKKILNCK